MKNKKKLVLYLIIFLAVLLLVAGVTYTWFKWRSSNNSNVRITINNTSELVITFDGGSNVTGTLEPTLTKEEGIVKNFSASTNGLDVPMNIWLKINTLPDALKDSTFKWELYKDSVYLSGGSFNGSEITTRTSGNTTDYNLVTNDIVGSTTVNYTLYLWIDGNVDNNLDMAGKSFDFDLYATVSSEDFNISYGSSAASYITALYNNSPKTNVTNNGITYNYATSVNLMNDRHASMSTDINGGDIRFYGANPNNYVWLGETYASACSADVCGIARSAGEKKLYRIIGIFDNKLKLIQNDSIGHYSWDTSDSSVYDGWGINQWGESTYSDTGDVYSGADLMRLLNPGYESNQDLDKNGDLITVNNSLYWNSGSGNCYVGRGNYTVSCDFSSTGLTDNIRTKIAEVTWNLGGVGPSNLYSNDVYNDERGTGVFSNTNVVRTLFWIGKIGLLYTSDYGYATDFNKCTSTINKYGESDNCISNNWLFCESQSQVCISPYYYQYGNGSYVRYIAPRSSYTYASSDDHIVRPVFYLNSDLIIESGTGTEVDPYVLK